MLQCVCFLCQVLQHGLCSRVSSLSLAQMCSFPTVCFPTVFLWISSFSGSFQLSLFQYKNRKVHLNSITLVKLKHYWFLQQVYCFPDKMIIIPPSIIGISAHISIKDKLTVAACLQTISLSSEYCLENLVTRFGNRLSFRTYYPTCSLTVAKNTRVGRSIMPVPNKVFQNNNAKHTVPDASILSL